MKESIKFDYSYLHIISGEDYPFCSLKEMIERLNGNDTYTLTIKMQNYQDTADDMLTFGRMRFGI